MQNVLVCDDDEAILESLRIYLDNAGFNVITAVDGQDALEKVQNNEIHCVVLDIMMPRLDGLKATLKIREKYNFPIILLSAKSEDTDKITGLGFGADDYVTKPFSPSELVARVDAIYRRVCMSENTAHMPKVIESGCFRLDQKSRTVSKNGEIIDLTQVEYQIMELFLKNQNVALDRNQILTEIWGDNYYGDIKIVDVNIRRLRMKVEEEPSNPKYISTVWGYGYKWCGAAE